MTAKFDPNVPQWIAETVDTGSDCTTLDESLATAARLFPEPFRKLNVSRAVIKERVLKVGYVSFYGLSVFYVTNLDESLL